MCSREVTQGNEASCWRNVPLPLLIDRRMMNVVGESVGWGLIIWKELLKFIVLKDQISVNMLTFKQASCPLQGCWAVEGLLDRVPSATFVIKYRSKHDRNGRTIVASAAWDSSSLGSKPIAGAVTPGEASPLHLVQWWVRLRFRQGHWGLQKTIIPHSEIWLGLPQLLKAGYILETDHFARGWGPPRTPAGGVGIFWM